jgi:uncharacterized integral membrane protein
LIFIIQNAHVVQVSFLGIDVRLYLAVALLLTLIAGAALMTLTAVVLLMTAAKTARIAQLRRAVGRALLATPPPAPGRPRPSPQLRRPWSGADARGAQWQRPASRAASQGELAGMRSLSARIWSD